MSGFISSDELGKPLVAGPIEGPEQRRNGQPLYTRAYVQTIAINASLICIWYILSLSISIYNKWLYGVRELDFQFPLFTTGLQMFGQFLFAAFTLWLVPSLRPAREDHLTPKSYLLKICPCGISTGLDIGLSNASLMSITLGFYTMCKSSNLAFVLLFAFAFGLESVSIRLMAVIGIITFGVILMVATETRFVLEGFLLVISAAAIGGLRWSLTELLLRTQRATANPISTLFHLTPVMSITLLLIALAAEGPVQLIEAQLWTDKGWTMVPILAFPALLAFGMNLAEFTLIQRTGAVTLSVAGIFKECLTIVTSAVVFGDVLGPVNVSGVIVTLAGIAYYNYLRFSERREVSVEVFDKSENGDDESDAFAARRESLHSGSPDMSPKRQKYVRVSTGDLTEQLRQSDSIELRTR